MNLSIIIPTIARKTLPYTLDSIAEQSVPPAEVLLIGDGPQPAAEKCFLSSGLPGRYIAGPRTGLWGHAQRMLGAQVAAGDWLAYMDDDDVYLPNSFAAMQAAIEREPAAQVHLFRMVNRDRGLLWADRETRRGNVSTQMILVRREIAREVAWGRERMEDRGGDHDFIAGCAARAGHVVWHERIIAHLRP